MSSDDTPHAIAALAVLGRLRGLSRRRQVAVVGVVTLLVVGLLVVALVPGGVLGLVVNERATFDGTPATPDNETLNRTGYELNNTETVTVERQLTIAGQQRTVVVNNPQRVYRKYEAVQNRTVTAGVFATATTPAINVAGNPRNPIAKESHREILNRFQSNLNVGGDNVTFENVSTREAVLVGSRTTVTEFRANISLGGERREFSIHVTTARSDGDIVIAIGGHPSAFADERVAVMRLLYAVEHRG